MVSKLYIILPSQDSQEFIVLSPPPPLFNFVYAHVYNNGNYWYFS
jgi:hypothetical protein